MTHKNEMVLVPRELLSRIVVQFMFSLRDCDYQAICAILAAPADDVRAVVDEQVVYQVKIHGMTLYWKVPSVTPGAINAPLYRHSQRPMILPERQDPGPALHQWPQGWNDCLDKIADLNK